MRRLPRAILLIASLIPATPLLAQGLAPPADVPQVQPVGPVNGIPAAPSSDNAATGESALTIGWEVRNRFRLFREERDFLLHADALKNHTILQSEDALAAISDGRGWARYAFTRLCIDPLGRPLETCTRDGVAENYLAPADHAVTARLTGPIPVGATCVWIFSDGGQPQQLSAPCTEPVNLRVRQGLPMTATVDVQAANAFPVRATTTIEVRDLLIAGLGDSVASGEGNPDRAIRLADDGFCFRTYLDGGVNQYFRPGRAGFKGDRACGGMNDTSAAATASWRQKAAGWSNAACHRSLYSYQTRAAIALAVRHPHIAVTYLPLACTGATIADGLFGPQSARECPASQRGSCGREVPAQLASLRAALAAAKKRDPSRALDLIFLTVGANDIDFSGLVADAIVDRPLERAIFRRSGVIGSLDNSQALLARDLPQTFVRLRRALKPLVNGDLSHVVFVSYAHPALANGATCPGGHDGFDIHPAFGVSPARLDPLSDFVQSSFLPRLRNLALCEGGAICETPQERMTFVDQHQALFSLHGFCSHAATDPEFDLACFSPSGDSFHPDPVNGAANPLVCGHKASDYRAYAPRARWIRTANDSYFAAMTFPEGLSSIMQPTDIHDANWGILSAVYGGAVHPTAEGHAAMADAAYPAAETALGLTTAEAPLSVLPSAPPATQGATSQQ